jgi:para-nitrobenzyl esterase
MVQSEDCLQLNVFAPAELPETPVPVMVWIHGGANNTGSANAIVHKPALYGDDASSRLYDGAVFRELAEREVVVVTVNYRLGVLGFMSHRGLTTEQRASGNYGLMDQRAALHWVQRNIAAFGGDAERVTLFGQSGGATDVCYHLVSDDSRGLFQAAVLESGSCGPVRLPELAEAEQQGKELAAELGCAQTNPADSLSCLRAKPAPEFARPTPRDQLVSRELSGLAVIDGHVLREQPETSLAAGHFARVPLVVGTDDHDGSYLFSQASSQALELVDADPSAAESTDVSGEYPAIIDGLTSAAISDAYFTCPARRLAARMSQDAPVFLYRFRRSAAYEPSIQPFESRDVAHGVDQLWLWNVWPALSPYANDDVQLSLQMRSYFMQLIDGDVNTDAPQRWTRPQWPKFEREHPAQLVFDLEITSSEARRDGDCEAFD